MRQVRRVLHSRTCIKTPDTLAACMNCQGKYPINYSKCPSLLFLLKDPRSNSHIKILMPHYYPNPQNNFSP
ncbi:hypothetical protein WH47_02532 [Habropoda laboriosa]|uniref:Uncharacterized protein n=1 Tax=Habropoda laboriosa TaxID=597456 RepID=A0A0L7QW91_9HYME|nr:hypothetical protein WH47_02532 [Habropoda laboriosa]